MAIRDLIPRNRDANRISIHRGQTGDSVLDLQNEMNRMFSDFLEHPFFEATSPMGDDFTPRVDISESDKNIMVAVELPGMEVEDIDISLNQNTLTISGEKKTETEKKGKQFHRIERSYGSFRRSIPLPADVDQDRVAAAFERGVLTVNLPKSPSALEQGKRITIKQG